MRTEFFARYTTIKTSEKVHHTKIWPKALYHGSPILNVMMVIIQVQDGPEFRLVFVVTGVLVWRPELKT